LVDGVFVSALKPLTTFQPYQPKETGPMVLRIRVDTDPRAV
jgi:hypothetical protein